MAKTNFETIKALALKDAEGLKARDATYGSSWRKRGGVGAFMMLARKWDRIENLAKQDGWDIFTTGENNTGDILDDIADLRRYLLLVEEHVRRQRGLKDRFQEKRTSDPLSGGIATGGPTPAYIRQAQDGPAHGPGALPPSWRPPGV